MVFCPRVPVNGSILNSSVGKTVSLTGNVISTNPSGTSFDVRTCDKHIVTVAMKQPLSEPVTGLVEVHGKVNSKSSLLCDYYIAFPKELSDTYDEDIANEAIILINNVPNEWIPK